MVSIAQGGLSYGKDLTGVFRRGLVRWCLQTNDGKLPWTARLPVHLKLAHKVVRHWDVCVWTVSEPCSFIVCFRFTVPIVTLGHILAFQTRTRLEEPTFKQNGRFLWVSIPAGLARSDWQRLGLYRPREQAQALSWSSWMSNLCRESEHDFPRVGVC